MKLFFKCKCCNKKNTVCELIMEAGWHQGDFKALETFVTLLQGNIKNGEKLEMRIKQSKFMIEKSLIRQDKFRSSIYKHEILLKAKKAELDLEERNINEYRKWINFKGEKGIRWNKDIRK